MCNWYAGVQMLVIAQLQAALLPAIGAALSSVFGVGLAVYNVFKLSSWILTRMVNFDTSMLNLRWARNWQEIQQVPDHIRIENARRNQQQFINVNEHNPFVAAAAPLNPASNMQQAAPRAFVTVWHQYIETRDLKELFERLQMQYSSSYSRKL